MGIRITSLPKRNSLNDADYFVIADPNAGVTYKILSSDVRSGFLTSSANTAVGTTSPTFQLSLTDASGLPYTDPLGGPILKTNTAFGGLEIKDPTNAANYWDIIAEHGVFAAGISVGTMIEPTLFTVEVGGNTGPGVDIAYDLGGPTYRWRTVYGLSGSFDNVSASVVNSTNATFTNLTTTNFTFLGSFGLTRIVLASASVAAPAVAFTGSDDSGLYLNTTGTYPGVALSTGATNAAIFSSASIQLLADVTASGNLVVSKELYASAKSFLIPHPTKPAMKLQHGSLEGPEHAVFVRGKLENTNIIFLPEYWRKLVDADTITVQLTPIGEYQKLFISHVSDKEIIVKNDSLWSNSVNCYYTVIATRKDISPLKVEF